jgi:hypothetical protein
MKTLFFLAIAMLGCMAMQAQNAATFRIVCTDDTTKTVVYAVMISAQGQASYTRAVVARQASDHVATVAIGLSGDFALSSVQGSDTLCIDFTNPTTKYWFLKASNQDPGPVGMVGNSSCVSCDCKHGSGTCSTSGFISGGVYTATCVTNVNCDRCKMSVATIAGPTGGWGVVISSIGSPTH